MPRLLRGSGGSQVELTYESPAGTEKSTTFTRQRVQIRSITRTVMLDETRGIGYIRMEGFQNNTAEELDEALRTLERKGMKAAHLGSARRQSGWSAGNGRRRH